MLYIQYRIYSICRKGAKLRHVHSDMQGYIPLKFQPLTLGYIRRMVAKMKRLCLRTIIKKKSAEETTEE